MHGNKTQLKRRGIAKGYIGEQLYMTWMKRSTVNKNMTNNLLAIFPPTPESLLSFQIPAGAFNLRKSNANTSIHQLQSHRHGHVITGHLENREKKERKKERLQQNIARADGSTAPKESATEERQHQPGSRASSKTRNSS